MCRYDIHQNNPEVRVHECQSEIPQVLVLFMEAAILECQGHLACLGSQSLSAVEEQSQAVIGLLSRLRASTGLNDWSGKGTWVRNRLGIPGAVDF